jgi:amino acid transporter
MFAIAVIVLLFALALKFAPKSAHHSPTTQQHIQTAGQIGLMGAVALFGVDYFSSFFYATGEMLHVLHPLGLQSFAWIPVVVVSLVNVIFGGLYIYSLGPFNEGGGSYTASMRYLAPVLSLIVAVTLLEDYVMTVVVSALSGADQFLSILGQFDTAWYWHFGIAALLAAITWFLTIRGRGESARAVFILLFVFVLMTGILVGGLIYSAATGSFAPLPPEHIEQTATLSSALFALLGASMKGLVALTGLEAMSNGIQFVKDEDASIITWAKRRLPRYEKVWDFYSGKVGIGRLVQSSFLFYGGLTTSFAAIFAVHFNVFDGTMGRTLIGNLAYIGYSSLPGGTIFFGAYQLLSVLLLAAASMTAFQDTQATAWRDVAIGELPEVVCYRDPKGTFTRSVTATFVVSVIIMLLVRGQTSHAIPFYGVGVFLPIMIMGLAIRRHMLQTVQKLNLRRLGAALAGTAAFIAGIVFLSQVFARWEEGGWFRLVTFTVLFGGAHLILISRFGKRSPEQITHIVRNKAQVQGAMASIVEWQAIKMQEYRYHLLQHISNWLRLFNPDFHLGAAPLHAGPYNPDHHLD